MKLKNKGKVYPSPASPEMDALSVLKLLPAAILALASLLSLEDREVLAYLISRSLKTTTNPSSIVQDPKKRSSKKPAGSSSASAAAAQPHKPPRFDCDCFDCYTSYWFRWDSSPNRELINQAIEAFEDHLANGEKSKKAGRGKRRDKAGRRVTPSEKIEDVPVPSPPGVADIITANEVSPPPPEIAEEIEKKMIGGLPEAVGEAAESEEEVAMAATNHKGTTRKVLPDVLGLVKSRVWSLWNPIV